MTHDRRMAGRVRYRHIADYLAAPQNVCFQG